MAVEISRGVLRDSGRLYTLLSASPDARRFVLDFSPRNVSDLDDLKSGHHIAEDEDEAALMVGALSAFTTLRQHISSLTVLHLSGPLPIPSATTLAYLASCDLTELELQDISIKRAASDGVSNLLRSSSPTLLGQQLGGSLADSIRARGAAMVRFACSVPSLQRLSLCNAAFSASDISSLAALTRLEELSVTGAMECVEALASFPPPQPPSPLSRPRLLDPSAAVPPYMQLLAALPRLRRLRLPMAIATPSYMYGGRTTGNGWESDDCEDDEDEVFNDSFDDDCGSCVSQSFSMPYTDAHTSSSCGGLFASSCLDLLMAGASGAAAARHTSECSPLGSFELREFGASPAPASGCGADSRGGSFQLRGGSPGSATGGFPDGGVCLPRSGKPPGSAGLQLDDPHMALALMFPSAIGMSTSTPLTAPTTTLACSTDAVNTRTWCFPPHLEELTIPLCNLNGPVFRAACTAYGSESGRGSGSDHPYSGGISGRGRASTHQKLRSLQVICAPGYSVWEGSFLNGDRDFAAVARLAPSLECLHLCLELGSSGRNVLRKDRLRSCLGHLKALHRMQDLRLVETRQPVCFSTRRSQPVVGNFGTDVLFDLLDDYGTRHVSNGGLRKQMVLPPLALPMLPRHGPLTPSLPKPSTPDQSASSSRHPSLASSLLQPSPLNATSPPFNAGGNMSAFGPLVFGAAAKPSIAPVAMPSTATGGGSVSGSRSASPSLDSLLSHWPQLRTLVVCGQCAVRTDIAGQTRLVRPASLEQVSMLLNGTQVS